MPRRHDALIPLSHQHHHALALCQRIDRVLGRSAVEHEAVLALRTDTLTFFARDLVAHLAAEERILFPAMEGSLGPSELLHELIGEHRQLEQLARDLDRLPDPTMTLHLMSSLLRAHIRKEEDRLFPCFEARMPDAAANALLEPIRAGITPPRGDARSP